jgi:hypothetical protein
MRDEFRTVDIDTHVNPSCAPASKGNPTPSVYQRLDFPMRIPVSGGPNRRRWEPYHVARFRKLVRVLRPVWKGSHFGAEPHGGPLLEEWLTRGAIDIAFEHDRPPRDATQCALRDRRIVPHQVKLGVAGWRKEWLVGVRDHDLTASELQDGLAHLPHRIFCQSDFRSASP